MILNPLQPDRGGSSLRYNKLKKQQEEKEISKKKILSERIKTKHTWEKDEQMLKLGHPKI